jgi:hypothetical protein
MGILGGSYEEDADDSKIVSLGSRGDDYGYAAERLQKLEAFFKAVAKLTLNHEVIGDRASVSPRALGWELEKVNPEWWK